MSLKQVFDLKKSSFYGLCLLCLMSVLVTSCNSSSTDTDYDDDNDEVVTIDTSELDIIAAAKALGSLDTLINALADADLEDTLSDESRSFTLFAATDETFEVWGDITNLSESELRSLLLYHVLDSDVDEATGTSSSDELVFTENGQAVIFNIDDSGVWTVNGVQVTTTDIETSNGTIHILDEVLTPEENPDFLWTSYDTAESVEHHLVAEALFADVGEETFMRYFYGKSLGDSATSDPGTDGVSVSGSWNAVTDDYYPYQIWLPDNLEEDMPLTLILHTAGEKGDNNTSQLTHSMATTWASSMEQATILVAPQAPNGSQAWSIPDLNTLLDTIINDYDIDTDRLYINGHSFGGVGVLDMLSNTEHSFAAAALFAPSERNYDQLDIEQISQTPQWYVVSEIDHIVDADEVFSFYSQLIAQ